jgi:hypothetical protein
MRLVARCFSLAGLVAAIALGAMSAACSSGGSSSSSGSSNSTPTTADYDEVAQSVAPIVADDVHGFYVAQSLALDFISPGVTKNADGTFGETYAGVTYTYTVVCFDASNADTACSSKTSSATVAWTWQWDVSTADFTESGTAAENNGKWTLSGLQGSAPTANLAGLGSYGYEFATKSASTDAQASGTWTIAAQYDVTFDKANIDVTGGTIDYIVAASGFASDSAGEASGSYTIKADVTFSNDTWTLALDGSHTYTVTASGTLAPM